MPTPRKYATNAARQAAYRARGTRVELSACSSPPSLIMGQRRWAILTGQAKGILAGVAGEMAAYGEARSDAWHESERGEQFSEQMEALEEILDLLRDLTVIDHR